MTVDYIRAFDKKILGILKTYANGDQVILDFPSKTILGFYNAKDNNTRNFSHVIVSKGNTLIALLYQYKETHK